MQQKPKQFFLSRECGGIALWSLHNPVDPQIGHWAWGEIKDGNVRCLRPLTSSEISFIRTRYMVWGETIKNQPWAIVYGRDGGSNLQIETRTLDPIRSVGV